jgi:hypothetical protein
MMEKNIHQIWIGPYDIPNREKDFIEKGCFGILFCFRTKATSYRRNSRTCNRDSWRAHKCTSNYHLLRRLRVIAEYFSADGNSFAGLNKF